MSRRSAIWVGAISTLAVVAGQIQIRLQVLRIPEGAGVRRRLVYGAAGDALFQLGLVGLVVALLFVVRPAGRPSPGRSPLRLALRLALALGVLFVTGELALRALYPEGTSFGMHGGPLVRRFERDFTFNHYDGPSRGPEVRGPKPPGTIRILIQGDSITWGQGVRSESDLFTSRLLESLGGPDSSVQMAVLAAPGREIDGHLAQLRQWGPQIDPDIVIYQWYVNDMELDHARRPVKALPWRRLFFSDILRHYSYFWFVMDAVAAERWPSSQPSYWQYVSDTFGHDTPEWRAFRKAFAEWIDTAQGLTSNILVVLYPLAPGDSRDAELRQRVGDLAVELGVAVLDLRRAVPELGPPGDRLRAGRFDNHPNAEAHRLIGEALRDELGKRWAKLLDRPRREPTDDEVVAPRFSQGEENRVPEQQPGRRRSG